MPRVRCSRSYSHVGSLPNMFDHVIFFVIFLRYKLLVRTTPETFGWKVLGFVPGGTDKGEGETFSSSFFGGALTGYIGEKFRQQHVHLIAPAHGCM